MTDWGEMGGLCTVFFCLLWGFVLFLPLGDDSMEAHFSLKVIMTNFSEIMTSLFQSNYLVSHSNDIVT